MRAPDCRRFVALLDQVACEEGELAARDQAFLTAHAEECPSCALAIQLDEEVVRLGDGSTPDDPADEGWADAVVAAATRPRVRGIGRIAALFTGAGSTIAIVAAAAATTAIVVAVWTEDRQETTADTVQRVETPESTAAAGESGSETALAPAVGLDPIAPDLPAEVPHDAPTPADEADAALLARADVHIDEEHDAGIDAVIAPAESPTAIEELLALARQRRLEGDWSGAAAAYEQVIVEHPDSSESTMCLVPLAQIQLERLGRPQQALVSFREYAARAPAGPLLEEAEWGEAGALGALGRTDGERQTLQRFLEHHPGSLYASQASERLGPGG